MAGKYNELWKDVLHELEKMKSSLERSAEAARISLLLYIYINRYKQSCDYR